MQAVYTDYEPTGKIGQIDYHNGTATKYTYDAWSTKLFGIVTEDPTRDPLKHLQDREYTYSRAGDIIQIKDNAQKVTYDYAYDRLHRLVSEQLSGVNAPIVTKVETITLDYAGTGPVHGVKTIALNGVSRTCQYDANGNMITSPDFTTATNPLNRTITYDGDNMPTRIVHANGATVDFVYDGTGKRTKKLVQSGKTVLYLGDHFEVENGVNIKYIFGGNLRLAQIKGSLTSYFHKDHLNSTAAVTNEAGVKVESTTYEPYGSTRTQEGTAVSAYKFTDQELDNETNLYNYDARLYDPVLGMFVTPDSIVPDMFDPQELNRYSYCRNNPLVYVDPSGHMVEDGGSDAKTWNEPTSFEAKENNKFRQWGTETAVNNYLENHRSVWSEDESRFHKRNWLDGYPVANTDGWYGGNNNKKIMEMDPSLRVAATAVINISKNVFGLDVSLRDVRRSFGNQNTMIAWGRSMINPNTGTWAIATRAVGGLSPHNYGLAFDVFIENRSNTNQSQVAALDTVGSVASALGLEWGGSWSGKFVDRPHFQDSNWRNAIPASIKEILRGWALDRVR